MSRNRQQRWLLVILALVVAMAPFVALAAPMGDTQAEAGVWMKRLEVWLELLMDRAAQVVYKAGPVPDPNGLPAVPDATVFSVEAGPVPDPNG